MRKIHKRVNGSRNGKKDGKAGDVRGDSSCSNNFFYVIIYCYSKQYFYIGIKGDVARKGRNSIAFRVLRCENMCRQIAKSN